MIVRRTRISFTANLPVAFIFVPVALGTKGLSSHITRIDDSYLTPVVS